MRAAAGAAQHDAFAELAVPNALSELQAARDRDLRSLAASVDGPRHDHRGAHFLHELGGDLAEEARRHRVAYLAVQPALLRMGDVQLALGARDADVTEAPFLLEAGGIVE